MDFAPTSEQQAVRDTFHRFAEREVRPRALELDQPGAFPRDLFGKAGELGLFALRYPAEGRPDVVAHVLALEELAWGSLALAAPCTMQSLMGTYFVARLAPAALRERLLPRAIAGQAVGAICMSEPGAGSDLGAVATRATPGEAGRWRLTGGKTWVTSAPVADFFTVVARTGDDRLSLFLVERGAPGLVVGRAIDKAGVRASLTSEVFFEDTPACLLGDEGAGMSHLKELLAEIRVATAALALGVGRAAFEEAQAHARARRQFGRPIGEFQAVQLHLAAMAVDLEAARRLTYWAAWRSGQGLPNASESAMAKLFASEAATRVCDRAARVLASAGFAAGNPVERYLRDVRFTLIGGGTSEILALAIAREL